MGDFQGLAQTYEASRHGYPAALGRHLTDIGALSPQSVVVDLGAGTGQLTRLLSPLVAEIIAVEPEPDMVSVGQNATSSLGNVRWMQGQDSDMRTLLQPAEVDLVVIGNAFHHMNQRQLLENLDVVISPGGWVCVASSSVPVWLQDSDWSRALRSATETELGPLSNTGVPDTDATATALKESSFSELSVWSVEQDMSRTCDAALGEIESSASGALSAAALDRLQDAIDPFAAEGRLPESVRTTAVCATRPAAAQLSPLADTPSRAD